MFTIRRISRSFINYKRYLSDIFDNNGQSILHMPKLMSAERGTIERWLKNEGEEFKAKETICEVTVAGVTIGMDVDEDGILAQIIHDKDSVVPVGSEIAVVTNDRESYLSFFEKIRLEKLDEQKALEFAEDFEAKHQKPSATVLMKVIKSLVREGKIKAGSEFATTLMGLARKGDTQLINVFEASCEGLHYDDETFDNEFFLENAQAIVDEVLKKKDE